MIVTYQDNFGRISSDAPTMYIYAQIILFMAIHYARCKAAKYAA
jgi:hypothetical protein